MFLPRIYPVGLNLEDKLCVVVGGGTIALRKVESLLACGARVKIVAPGLTGELQQLVHLGQVQYLQAEFDLSHLESACLVIGATDNQEVNANIAAAAKDANIPVNIVDKPALCSFFVPASVRRGNVTVSVFTGGDSPALAKRLRQELELRFDRQFGEYATALGRLRARVKEKLPRQEERAEVFTWLASRQGEEVFRRGGEEALKAHVEKIVTDLGGVQHEN